MLKITLKNIKKSYKRVDVLKDVCLTVNGGQAVGIVGQNGSGKSVLFRIILGLEKADEGTIISEPKLGIKKGAIIDGENLFRFMTPYENLKYLSKIRKEADIQTIDAVLKRVGLYTVKNKSIDKFSNGMQKRLLMAQAIMEKNDLLVFDEATNSLDEDGRNIFKDIVNEEKARGAIIIMSSHYREDIEELCDMVYEMENGCLNMLKEM